MKIFDKFNELNNNQKHIVKFSIGLVCFITFLASLILSHYGVTIPLKIILGMFTLAVLGVGVYILWEITKYDD